ncbi:acyl-CoA-binding domain-containing protein 4 isoform X1 [Scleropages formosus]|uniref:acyl-CoA-binding domain-containing protein 4 isoform X1 n=1 Tax=Scleropages formosus TaxID=113540 RepID=UPI0010FA8576|nr:acyl-CoA-binding domain-containing protein 4 isoform X1 [Scleropages formosus]XP_029102572.1 acyl-CoA-binding domain-containing protein 4 isoform X1 [Scleropages formosus]
MPPDSRTLRARPSFTVAAAMTQPEEECRRRFRAAVDVIQSLPKNGSYRPSYEVMLRFYGLYKQAVFGPCRSSRPGFWDPVGRYKWDAWSRLGEMSGEDAMTEYVEEMKKVAQEVIDSVPVNKKTASLFHYFEPLYLVIHDMPRPPEALLSLRAELEAGVQTASPAQGDSQEKMERDPEQAAKESACGPDVGSGPSGGLRGSAATATFSAVEPAPPQGSVGTSDSESEVFCDSLERLDRKAARVGAGAGEERAPPPRGRGFGLEARRGQREETHRRAVCPGGGPRGGGRRAREGASGDGGGDEREGSAARQREAQMQRQIVSTLRQLREDMFGVMERLEAVERMAAAQARGLDRRSTGHPAAPSSETQQESRRWPLDASGRAALLLLLWPFAAHALASLLRRHRRESSLGPRGRR